MPRKLSAGTNGFTLVELLVVISIIALLLAILVPALNKAREQSRKIVCSSLIRAFGMGNQAYVSTYDGWCLPYTTYSIDYCTRFGGHGYVWCLNEEFRSLMGLPKIHQNPNGLASYYTLPKQFKCPTDKRKIGKGIFSTSAEYSDISFGYNMTQKNSYYIPAITSTPYLLGFRSEAIKSPSNKIAFMDGVDSGVHQVAAEWRKYWDRYGDWDGPPNTWNAASYRHTQGANVNFFDGHTEYRKKEQIFKVDSYKRPVKAANRKIWQPLEDCGLM